MRIFFSLVSEVTDAFINQSKLCLYSLRKNGGKLKDIPVLFVTNNSPMSKEDIKFFLDHFSPIRFFVMERIDIVPPASKLNVFSVLDPLSYDIMIFSDCDTVILRNLDDMLDPILEGECDFLCRRGGGTDRDAFVDREKTIRYLGLEQSKCMVKFQDTLERPQFNSGVFAFRSSVAKVMGERSKSIIGAIFNDDHIKRKWMAEQCSVALACIQNEIRVTYMDEIFNSWGNLEDIRILHCFKSRYKFDRSRMFKDFPRWRNDYTTVPGEKMLVEIVDQYIREIRP